MGGFDVNNSINDDQIHQEGTNHGVDRLVSEGDGGRNDHPRGSDAGLK